MPRNPMNPSEATNIDWYDKYLALDHQHIRTQARLKALMRENAQLKRLNNELLAQQVNLYDTGERVQGAVVRGQEAPIA